jgi:hypothetical protein
MVFVLLLFTTATSGILLHFRCLGIDSAILCSLAGQYDKQGGNDSWAP